jgi:SAM-dependent methyltransferase
VSEGRGVAWYRTAFGAHYPALYAHRDRAEARRCLALLPRLAPLGRGPVLDLGCGEGRHLRELTAAGVAAVGLDLSAPLLSRARTAATGRPLVRGDMRRLPFRDQACSAVLSLFTAFGYFGPVARHEPVVSGIARVLTPGGHWFLDFLDSERVAAELAGGAPVRERELGGVAVHEQRQLASAPRRVIKTVTLTPGEGDPASAARLGIPAEGLQYREEVTLMSLEELDGLAAGAGLVRVAAAGDYDGAPLQPGASARWLLVYRRAAATGGTP